MLYIITTFYSGGYSNDHSVIEWFWEALSSFTDEQLRNLLQFVTSCSRPPLTGFKVSNAAENAVLFKELGNVLSTLYSSA